LDKKALTCCKSVRLKTMWAMDFDYLSQLSDEELRFLAEFCNFFYHGSPNRTGSHIKVDQQMRKESYNRNNKAEIDLFNHSIRTELTIIEEEPDFNIENYIIDFIDNKCI